MPKLVNTDKVAEAIDWLNEYDFVLWHDVMECIDKVPEVEAIPIEWIKEWVNNYCDWSQEQLIGILLRTWNKKRQPTVDAESVKHGHWEWTDDPRTGDFMCSNCLDHNIVRSRYCPNCGAIMDLNEVENG